MNEEDKAETTFDTSCTSKRQEKVITFFRKKGWNFLDWIWPSIQPTGKKESDRIALKKQRTREDLEERANSTCRCFDEIKAAKASLEYLLEQEGTRRQRVEARLINTVGFSAVSVSIIIAISKEPLLNASIASGISQRVLLGILEFYSVSQLLLIGWNSFQGLQRRSYRTISPLDVLPTNSESQMGQIRRYISTLFNCIEDNDKQNCIKVEKMALVYTSARNYLLGIGLLTLYLLSLQLIKPTQIDEVNNKKQGDVSAVVESTIEKKTIEKKDEIFSNTSKEKNSNELKIEREKNTDVKVNRK